METSLITYDKESLVIQANELIRAEQDELTLLESKIILLTIAQVVKQDTDLRTYSCNVSSLAEFLEIPSEEIYRDIWAIAKGVKGKPGSGITKKNIYLIDKSNPKRKNGKPNYKIFPWVDYFEYQDGIITIRLSDKLKPYLIGLNILFTEYGFDCIRTLPTSTSIRLYQLLASYESMANPYSTIKYHNPYPNIPKENYELIFTVEYLRQYFNCIDKYPNTGDFIKWVIDTSVKGINKKSPDCAMRVSYRVAKEGRKIAYVLFKINAWEDKDFRDFLKSCL